MLRENKDVFAWTPQYWARIDPGVIIHHLNIDPRVKLVKQKRRNFGPKKDKIIQVEVNELLVVGHIKEIQFPEWFSNVALVPKHGGKWRMCIDFRDLNKASPMDFYLLLRIDQLVDSTSKCELLSMMDALQGYHHIMLAPKDHKRVSFNTSHGIFCYVAVPFGLKNTGATYQRIHGNPTRHRSQLAKIKDDKCQQAFEELKRYLAELPILVKPVSSVLNKALEERPCLHHVDRSSTTQGSGAAIVITSPQGEDMEFGIKFGFKASNNEAKYKTLVLGMRMAQDVCALREKNI
ncbi:Transposon Ty3-G Gag-Pol polyprotein [Sesamum angolense]|uniref:Transposon Ty3-G Gag-Pol polyprotein n=1 Tax=Sesamum angolense TaxID=2727404 RepID=A0AAE2BS80_9LAMI|nr:Transposon Ty3-G Gag-Pol polyprotein [Sesamum angolense]